MEYEELVGLAREAIRSYLEGKKVRVSESIKKKYSKKGACFVTLTMNGQLRGCIGSLIARQELWKDVIENAINSAFGDPRFLPLSKEEFERIKIEISILSEPKRISYSSIDELFSKTKGKGVVIKKGFFSATYLPSVWEDLPDEERFFSSLCLKAGLKSDEWKKPGLEVFIYEAIKVSEN